MKKKLDIDLERMDGENVKKLKFPFKNVLSLDPLTEFWHQTANFESPVLASLAKNVIREIEKVPELSGPIKDLSVISKNKDIMDLMMTPLYPPTQHETLLYASIVPFELESFYSSKLFDKLINLNDEKLWENSNIPLDHMAANKILKAYLVILNKFYGRSINLEHPLIFRIKDPETGLDKYLKFDIDTQFLLVKKVGDFPDPTEEEINFLLTKADNLNYWFEKLPPENFEFYGFATFKGSDVTDQEILSNLKNDLLEKEALISTEGFKHLESTMQCYMRIPDLQLGLTAFYGDSSTWMEYSEKIGNSLILNCASQTDCNMFENSIYTRAYDQGKSIIIEDLNNMVVQEKNNIEKQLLKMGIQSIVVSPLIYNGNTIGIIELGSKTPYALNQLSSMKIKNVLSMFSIAVSRSIEEYDNKIQAIIKVECTALHPTVEWRFRRAAVNMLKAKDENAKEEMEPIVFDGVYPLFGLSDIRNSSVIRNNSIQSDLIEQLRMARDVLRTAHKSNPLHSIDELIFQTNNYIMKIRKQLSSGDDVVVINFLHREVESIFDHIKSFDANVAELVANYRKALDPDLNTFYSCRKDYEESVRLINDSISIFIDRKQDEAQEMFPHYFEKYKTDGVEHSIYIGQSLVYDKEFCQIYLKNLRLWQLITVSEIAQLSEDLKPKMKIELDTTHLILVQDTSLSIRFRPDEKKFDVDGTYNIRYEIMKKRIDKALINGTAERLTQPGMIAIVYTHDKEAEEYRKYIAYLQTKGYFQKEVEDLKLEELQGVQGLRALRVAVNIKPKKKNESIGMEEVVEVVDELAESLI